MTTGTTIGALALFAVPAAAISPTTTSFYLDSHNPTDSTQSFCSENLTAPSTPPGCGNTITAPIVFASGVTYTVNVAGAVSVWGAWPYRRCGAPEPNSEFPSPGVGNQPAGDDAQFRFAEPRSSGKCDRLPKKTGFFQVNLGNGWIHPVAVNNPSKPSRDNPKTGDQHPYTFTFLGQGTAPQFRFVDYHASDNSGRFKLTVTAPAGT